MCVSLTTLPWYSSCLQVEAKQAIVSEAEHEGCYKPREDYFECLHNRKERARVAMVLAEQERQKRK